MPDGSRRTPEGRRRLRDFKLETKPSPSPMMMANEPGSLPDLSSFPCSIPLSTSQPPCSSSLALDVAAPLTEPLQADPHVQVKLEDPDASSSLQEAELPVLGDPMDCVMEPADIFNLLGDAEEPKMDFSNLDLDCTFDQELPDLTPDPIEGLNTIEQFGMGADLPVVTVVNGEQPNTCPDDNSPMGQEQLGSPVALGIPYYVACQWEQQVQVQQQQTAAMLWWQAYLCGACGIGAAAAPSAGLAFPGQQMGWTLPHPMPSQTSAVPEGFFPHLAAAAGIAPMNAGKAVGNASSVPKRRRRQDGGGSAANGGDALNSVNNKKGRRPKQEERVCKNCGTRSTPFWRKNKQDGLPLCNACGLYLAKNDAPRPKVLWKAGPDEPGSEPCAGPSEHQPSHDMMDVEVASTKIEPDAPIAGPSVAPSTPPANC